MKLMIGINRYFLTEPRRAECVRTGELNLALHYLIGQHLYADQALQQELVTLLVHAGAELEHPESTLADYLNLSAAPAPDFITSLIFEQNRKSRKMETKAVAACFLSTRCKRGEDGLEFMKQLIAQGFNINIFNYTITTRPGKVAHCMLRTQRIVVNSRVRCDSAAFSGDGRGCHSGRETAPVWSKSARKTRS